MRKYYVALCFILLQSFFVVAQKPQAFTIAKSPADAGFSADRLKSLMQ